MLPIVEFQPVAYMSYHHDNLIQCITLWKKSMLIIKKTQVDMCMLYWNTWHAIVFGMDLLPDT